MPMARHELITVAHQAGCTHTFDGTPGIRAWTFWRNGVPVLTAKTGKLLQLDRAQFLDMLTSGKSSISEPIALPPINHEPMTLEDPMEFKFAPPRPGKAEVIKITKTPKTRKPRVGKVRITDAGHEVTPEVKTATKKFLAWRKKNGLDVGYEERERGVDMCDEIGTLTF